MKVPLCTLGEIPDGEAKTVDFFGREVLVLKAHGKPKAILNVCMHLGGPMQLQGDRLICQWHGAEFDCDHSKTLKGSARLDSRLITLPTRVEDGMLNYVYGE